MDAADKLAVFGGGPTLYTHLLILTTRTAGKQRARRRDDKHRRSRGSHPAPRSCTWVHR